MAWLDQYFRTGMRNVGIGGSLLPPETAINFVSGASASDNAAQGRTDVTINGSLVSAITTVAIAGATKPYEPILNFVSGATASDNPGSSRTDVTITGSGGIVKQIAINGSLLPPEVTINFVTGASAVDNPGSSRTDVTLAAGGYTRIASNGSLLPAESTLNFIGPTVADDSGHGRTNVTIPTAALYGTHSLTSNTSLSSLASANTLFYFTPSANFSVTIQETVGVPRVIYVGNAGTGNVLVLASTGQAHTVIVNINKMCALLYTGDATIGYLPTFFT